MTSIKDIKAAVGLLDPKDPTQWAAPGIPTLTAIQKLVPDATADDLTRAGFEAPKTETVAKPVPAAGGPVDVKDLPEVPDVLPPPQGLKDDMLLAIVTKARAGLADVEAEIAVALNERSQLTARIDGLVSDKDHLLRAIELYSPRVEFAQGVKAIQAQTGAALIQRKSQAIELSQKYHNLQAKAAPSILDASLAARRRTPAEKANLAAFIHQTAMRQVQERG